MKNVYYKCLIIGNSLALDGFDAQYLTQKGITAYNLAIGGATLKENLIQLRNFIKNNKKPRIVILGLSSCHNKEIEFDSERMNPIIEYTYGMCKWYSIKNLPMIKFKWLAEEIMKKILSKDYRKAKVELGQLKLKRVRKDRTNVNKYMKIKFEKRKYVNSKYLREICMLCRNNEIKIIIFEMPGTKETQNEIPVGPHFIKYKNGMEVTLNNLNNYSLCEKLISAEEDWLGNCHLNERGARKLTEYIYNEYFNEKLLKKE